MNKVELKVAILQKLISESISLSGYTPASHGRVVSIANNSSSPISWVNVDYGILHSGYLEYETSMDGNGYYRKLTLPPGMPSI